MRRNRLISLFLTLPFNILPLTSLKTNNTENLQVINSHRPSEETLKEKYIVYLIDTNPYTSPAHQQQAKRIHELRTELVALKKTIL